MSVTESYRDKAFVVDDADARIRSGEDLLTFATYQQGEALPPGGTAVVPDEPLLDPYLNRADIEIRRFAHVTEPGAFEVGDRTIRLETSFTARHQLDNTLAALHLCDVLGIDAGYVRKGLRVWKERAGGDRGRVIAFHDDEDREPLPFEPVRRIVLGVILTALSFSPVARAWSWPVDGSVVQPFSQWAKRRSGMRAEMVAVSPASMSAVSNSGWLSTSVRIMAGSSHTRPCCRR